MNNHIEHGAVHRLWREGRWQRTIVAICIALVLVVPAAQAQENSPPTLDQIQAVARELYCPLCNGVRLDNCDLQACVQMRQVISDRLAAGVAKDQIKQEFVAQYGPVVLGEPPREGLNWLIWLLPVVALIGGAVWVFMTLRGWTQAPAGPASAAPAAEPQSPLTPGASADSDDYLAQVDADLRRLE
ncbi:MAG TPA: cytochrome c-type biogenesis protein [Anaerolineae bacterium]|nr:cytochrome c-type biogenesis protein [Anaerolineae bacterium]